MKNLKKLTLLHSNDLHGDFLAERIDNKLVGGVSMLSGYINKVREEEENVIYCIAGDMFRGSVIDAEYKGVSTIEIMNLLGPDVVTIGNHEVDYGLAHLLFIEKCANFPIINANFHIRTNNKRLFQPFYIAHIDGMKILFIGNSFTKDAVEHLPGMLAAAGIKDIKLYHMYYGGRRIFEYTNGYTTSVDYHCYRCENGATSWTDVTGHSLHEIVSSDKWDIVTIQEHTGRAVAWDWTASQKAAVQGLVDKVKADCPEKTPDFYFIMSQAYHDMNKIATADRGQKNFTTTEEMYNVIVSMTKKLMDDVPFKDVIATGTCLQNLRTSSLNNSMCLTRDGYHMDYGISRYAAACMMFEKLISPSFDNVKLDTNAYRYNVSNTTSGSYSTPVTDANAPIALQAARYALEKPYVVTDMK